MGIRRTMAHHLPTQIRRFCRRNSTFVLANLLAAALVWSAYTNGYVEDIQETFFDTRDYENTEAPGAFEHGAKHSKLQDTYSYEPEDDSNPLPSREDYQLEVRPVPVQPVAAQQIQQAAAPAPAVPAAPAAAPVAPAAAQPVNNAAPMYEQVPAQPAVVEAVVKKASATGWIDPPNRGPPAVGEANTPPPSSFQENLPDISNADKSIKPPLKDFSQYQFATNFDRPIPNEQFIFHNKLPKAGSSTMNNILIMLGRKNRFNYRKLNPHNLEGDGLTAEGPLVNFVKNNVTSWPFLLLKHHLPMDFEKYNIQQPTYINVIRDPADWFQSHYYFERFGWTRKEDDRGSFNGSEEDKQRTIDQCVEQKNDQCMDPITWKYIEFFCGNAFPCNSRSGKEEVTKQAMMKAMHNIEHNFFAVGVLEQFDDTLKLFEKMLPRFFTGATEVYHSDRIAEKRAATKTVGAVPMNNATRHFFATGPLRYEYQLYAFTRQLFNERLKRAGIQSVASPYGVPPVN
ncbi:Oidioi.mRNA.OKI2018_I69.chr1.g1445.t1.cds [Oikopleura dioica]|uniref:Oidioi.mRNA.OKI2018_I69.chr1.g1445.t1.cds n=1 Tax=Oikopleura dioica TaxID=34765 RepID=A0ABN7SSZ8_OIKDI|nr:Oidioi.mRNA.OKI2018_I69.chr1.g1445.t1.cds [Oikopleura dioica]